MNLLRNNSKNGFEAKPYHAGMEKEEEKILARFDRGRAEFLKTIFRKARKGKIWFTVDIEEVSREICESRERIVAALTYLDEIGALLDEKSKISPAFTACFFSPNMTAV